MPLRRRFQIAMGLYAILAAVAWRSLDGTFRLAVWVFLGGLALKTYIAAFKRD